MSDLNLIQRLIKVRESVQIVKKTEEARAGLYSYKYASSSAVLSSLKKSMDENKVMIIPNVDKFTISDHQTKNGGHEYFTVLEMTYNVINADSPEDNIKISWTGQGLDTGEKGIGKALTYAEKYLFLKLFNIPTDADDPDKDAPREPRVSNLATEKQYETVSSLARQIYPEISADELWQKQVDFAAALGVKDPSNEWTMDEASKMISKLHAKIKQMREQQ